MALRLHARSNQTSALIEQRWLLPIVSLQQHLSWSIAEGTSFPTYKSMARQFAFLNQAHHTTIQMGAPTAITVRNTALLSAPIRQWYSAPRQVQSPTDIQRVFERHFLERKFLASAKISERLVHQTKRTERSTVVERRMTLHRDVVRTATPANEPLPFHTSTTEIRNRTLQNPPMQAALPQINVDQLADQVIRQIDRRVVARKERMGRI